MPTPSHPLLRDATVLVTGGTGAFGQAFCRYALAAGARRVAVYSRSESKQAEMARALPDDRMRFLIGDVRDATRLLDAVRDTDYVIHAAALKRVEVCEADPLEAIATNITGTAHVARACIERGVRRAVFLSTDKAAAPETLYGSTKLVAERLWTQANVYAAGTGTRFAATRYGNVASSTGSVIPLWKAQRVAGEVTLTDPRMTRFLMSLDEAVALVADALTLMRGGETFVPKIGATTMPTLAQVVAPGCVQRVVGARPGEKLHETLVTTDEAARTYDTGRHYVIEPTVRTWGTVPALDAPAVPADFVFRSDTARPLGWHELEELAA